MKPIKALRGYFLSRTIREKMLVLGLIAVLAVVWVSRLLKRTAATSGSLSAKGMDLREQQGWLNEQQAIERRSKAATENLDRSKTFDSVRLQGKMYEIAKAAGLGPNTKISGLPPVPTNLFKYNTVQVQILNVASSAYGSLLNFENEIHKYSPYIGIESAQVRVNPSTSQLTLQMRVFSVERLQ